MKKLNLILLAFICCSSINAQITNTLKPKVKTEHQEKFISVTYYHDNGNISQKGSFNTDGKLEGQWVSYNTNGKKLAVGNYKNGIKVGKWLFWTNNTIKEVEYLNSKIIKINQKNITSRLASR